MYPNPHPREERSGPAEWGEVQTCVQETNVTKASFPRRLGFPARPQRAATLVSMSPVAHHHISTSKGDLTSSLHIQSETKLNFFLLKTSAMEPFSGGEAKQQGCPTVTRCSEQAGDQSRGILFCFHPNSFPPKSLEKQQSLGSLLTEAAQLWSRTFSQNPVLLRNVRRGERRKTTTRPLSCIQIQSEVRFSSNRATLDL